MGVRFLQLDMERRDVAEEMDRRDNSASSEKGRESEG